MPEQRPPSPLPSSAATEEAALQRGRADRIRLITDAMPVLISYVDGDRRYRFVNKAYEDWFGQPRHELLGRRLEEVVGEAGYAAIRPFVEQTLAGERVAYEAEVPYRGAGRRFVAATYVPHVEDDGRILGFFALVSDLTERRRAEDALRLLAEASAVLADSLDIETTLRRLAELTVPRVADTCVVDLLDERGELRRFAVASVDQPKTRWVWDVAEAPLVPAATHGPAKVLRTGEAELLAEITDAHLVAAARDARHLKMLRRARLISHIIVPLRARGRTLGTLSFLTTARSGRRYGAEDLTLAEDLAGRVALAVDNARLYGEAQAALRVRDEFLTSITHDLRTPLTTITGRVQMLLRLASQGTLPSSAVLTDGLTAVDTVAARMNGLVGELVDLGRLESGRPLELERAPVDLLALARVCAAERQRGTSRHRIAVVCREAAVVGEWDGPRLERVLTNLLQNAVRYSPDGGAVTVTLASEGGTVQLMVADEGLGIPAADLPRIFERFHRGANVAGRITGAGIGLAGVKQIVEQHGGTIEVESVEGQGTTMTVRLPLA